MQNENVILASWQRLFVLLIQNETYLHRGRCFEECPDGFAPLDETAECVNE